jgi:hypothetical protein
MLILIKSAENKDIWVDLKEEDEEFFFGSVYNSRYKDTLAFPKTIWRKHD